MAQRGLKLYHIVINVTKTINMFDSMAVLIPCLFQATFCFKTIY